MPKKTDIVLTKTKTAILKIFQQVRTDILEQKDKKSQQRNKRGKGSNEQLRTKKYSK